MWDAVKLTFEAEERREMVRKKTKLLQGARSPLDVVSLQVGVQILVVDVWNNDQKGQDPEEDDLQRLCVRKAHEERHHEGRPVKEGQVVNPASNRKRDLFRSRGQFVKILKSGRERKKEEGSDSSTQERRSIRGSTRRTYPS